MGPSDTEPESIPDNRPGVMKFDQVNVAEIYQRVVDHDMNTGAVPEQFDISRRSVQQLAKQYRNNGEIPQLETRGRKPYAEYPDDLVQRVLESPQCRSLGQWPSLVVSATETTSLSLTTGTSDRLLLSPTEHLNDLLETGVNTNG